MTTDYLKYRGKCKELAEQACAEDPSLTLVRGWYHCWLWGKQPHWWAEDPEGKVVDPSAKQFPSKGAGTYEKYRGLVECEHCGKEVEEEHVHFEGHHVYCSCACHGRDVGF